VPFQPTPIHDNGGRERERRRQGRLEDVRAEGINRRLITVGGRAVAPLLRCLGSRSACLDFLFNLSTGAVRAAAKQAKGRPSDVARSAGAPGLALVGRGWHGVASYSIRLQKAPAAYGGRRWEPTFLLAHNKAIGGAIGAPLEML
jgi:hypothetical protein